MPIRVTEKCKTKPAELLESAPIITQSFRQMAMIVVYSFTNPKIDYSSRYGILISLIMIHLSDLYCYLSEE